MEKLALFKNRPWERQRNNNDAYLEDVNAVITKVNEIVDGGVGNIIKIGEITFEDINSAPVNLTPHTIRFQFADVKPKGFLLERVILKIAVPFVEDYYGGIHAITNISGLELQTLPKQFPDPEIAGIEVRIAITGTNQMWIAGRMDVYAVLTTYPELPA